MKKILIIFNKDSGSYQKLPRDPAEWIQEILTENEITDALIEVKQINSDLINKTVLQYSSENYDIIAASGGDGTINGIAALIKDSSSALGVLPMGTFNNFAKDCGIPMDFESAVLNLVNGETKMIDYGKVNDKIFLNNSSLGQYPIAVLIRERKRKGKNINKKLAMVYAVIKTTVVYPLFKVWASYDTEDESIKTPLIFIGNNRYDLSPFNIGKRKNLTSGQLCGYAVKCSNVFCGLKLAFLAFFMSLKLTDSFLEKEFSELELHSNKKKLNIAVDGEVYALSTPIKYSIRPASLKVIVPR